MAYESKTWVDRVTENPNRRRLEDTGITDTYDVVRDEGVITAEGDKIDAINLNGLETRVGTAFTAMGIDTYSCTKTGTVYDLKNSHSPANGKFQAVADYAEGDTFRINPTDQLFNHDNAVAGFINNTGGTLNASAVGNYSSPLIIISPSVAYKIVGHTYTQPVASVGLAWYDSTGAYISGVNYGGATGNGTYTAPATAYYVRYTINTIDLTVSLFELNSSTNTDVTYTSATTAVLPNGDFLPNEAFKTNSWLPFIYDSENDKLNFISAGGAFELPNYAGKLVVHVAASDSGNVDGTKVRIRNEQLGSNYVQTIDALGNTTFSLLDNHTYYVVLLDYPSSYYGAAATVTIIGGETQELTLTLDTTPHIVGWRMNIDTGVIEYTDGAAAFEPMTVTDGVFHAGSWENQWASLVKPCLLKNLIPQYYLKKNSYFTVDYEHQANGTSSDIRTGADGDVMNEVALAYYKTGIETTGEGTFAYFKLAKEPQDSTWCANAYLSRSSVIQDTIYLPAYEGYDLSGKLRSLSGVAPTVNKTIGEFRSLANANGTGYEQANLTQVQFLNNLMILFFKGVDSQAKIGKGVTSASAAINTGTMNDKPLFWGDQTGTNGMKFMGIENYYGNVYKWLDGVGYLATNHFGYKIVPPFNDDRAGYADSGVAIPSTGYINRMSRANGYGMLPSATVSTEADSRYKDYVYALNSSSPIVAYGGHWSNGSGAGAFYWDGSTASYTITDIGASLFATPQ